VNESYLDGSLITRLSHHQDEKGEQDVKGLHPEEARVLEFLKESMAEEIH